MIQGWFSLMASGGGAATDIVSVQSFTGLSFPKTVPFSVVKFVLPYTVTATLRDASTAKLVVTWAEGDYDEATSDTYTLVGTLALSGGVTNPDDFEAAIDIEVVAANDPEVDLDNKILFVRENNSNTSGQVDQWTNDWNSANDLLKVADATRPNLNATGFNGTPSYVYTRANNDILRSEATLGLTGSFSYLILFQCTDPTIAGGQYLHENTNNGSAFLNTGIQALVNTSTLQAQFRKNNAGDQQIISAPFTNTGWNVLEAKHIANGTTSSLIVKLNGSLIDNRYGKDAVVHNSNLLAVGKAKTGTTTIGGSLALDIITSDVISSLESKRILSYLEDLGGASVSFDNYYDEDNLVVLNNGIQGQWWNGLDHILRGDNKYDFIGSDGSGKIYYFEQGATINDYTPTLIEATGLEIQSLKVLGRDSSNRLVILSMHKDGSSVGDNLGILKCHRADTTNDKGAYSTLNLSTAGAYKYPQQAVVYDINGSGNMQFAFTSEGTVTGEGRIGRFTCSNLADVLNISNWTFNNIRSWEGVWWCERATINGNDGLVFSARNTDGRNANAVAGIYFIQKPSTVTDAWPLTTIDNTAKDFGHFAVGDFFGNGNNDIIAAPHDEDDVYGYNAASAYSKSTIVTGGTANFGWLIKKGVGKINGRDHFLFVVGNDFVYRTWWNGSSWSRTKIFATGDHPADNECFHMDADNSGYLRWFMDCSTDLIEDNIRCFK